jgi:hypothetical protein
VTWLFTTRPAVPVYCRYARADVVIATEIFDQQSAGKGRVFVWEAKCRRGTVN